MPSAVYQIWEASNLHLRFSVIPLADDLEVKFSYIPADPGENGSLTGLSIQLPVHGQKFVECCFNCLNPDSEAEHNDLRESLGSLSIR